MKSSLLGSTSDSNINKYSTINKIPLIALNFSDGTEKKTHSPPATEKPIIAPKVKERTHNVTEKVTQVSLKIPICFTLKHLFLFDIEKSLSYHFSDLGPTLRNPSIHLFPHILGSLFQRTLPRGMDGKLANALIISKVVLKLDASMKMMRYDSLTAHYIKEEIMLQSDRTSHNAKK